MTIDWGLIILALACIGVIVILLKLIKRFMSAFLMIIFVLAVAGYAGYQGMEYGKTQIYDEQCQTFFGYDFHSLDKRESSWDLWCLDKENNDVTKIAIIETGIRIPAPETITTSRIVVSPFSSNMGERPMTTIPIRPDRHRRAHHRHVPQWK